MQGIEKRVSTTRRLDSFMGRRWTNPRQ